MCDCCSCLLQLCHSCSKLLQLSAAVVAAAVFC
jgi:hypothetical protein